MLFAAILILVCFAVTSAFGARPDVSVLSGTFTSPHGIGFGLAYAASYFATVLLAPPLLVAGVYRTLTRARRSERPS